MNEEILIKLSGEDLEQLLEGLSERAESWESIGEALRIRKMPDGRHFVADEAEYPSEADRIAVRYRMIMDRILDQAQACGWKP